MKYDAVVFDLDGTLTDSAQGIIKCLHFALNNLQLELPPESVLRKFLGPPLVHSFMQYCGISEELAIKATAEYRVRHLSKGWKENRVYPGIRELLFTLRQSETYLAIATGKPQNSSDMIVDHFSLSQYFDRVVGPSEDDHFACKSKAIQKALGHDRGRTVMVGDRASDILAAHELGIDSIAVLYGYGSKEELLQTQPTHWAQTVEDLYPLLGITKPKIKQSYFISLEGNDGCGKSTQAALLYDYLQSCGYDVIKTREPGGSEVAEKIRELLLDRENMGMQDMTEALLLAAARAQHVRDVIQPGLSLGKIVMTDRYVDSSVAYQGAGRMLGMDVVSQINAPAIDGCLPNLTLLLEIDSSTALRRRESASETDRIEMMNDDFHARVEEGYNKIAELHPDRIVRVNARGKKEEIAQSIIAVVKERFIKAGML